MQYFLTTVSSLLFPVPVSFHPSSLPDPLPFCHNRLLKITIKHNKVNYHRNPEKISSNLDKANQQQEKRSKKNQRSVNPEFRSPLRIVDSKL